MIERAITVCIASIAGIIASAVPAQTSGTAAVRPYLWSDARPPSEIGEINVFRRFDAQLTGAMRAFYGEVLALPVLPEGALGGGQMIRYPVGTSEVKLFPVAAAPSAGGAWASVGAAYGVRLLTFFFADERALGERFAAHELAAPRYGATPRAGAKGAALVQDPAGHWVELVIAPGAEAATLARFEIGVNAADLAASRAFYGDLIGLEAGPPVRDELIAATRYPFTHGATTINVWSAGAGLATDAQTAGMQYIVWNVAAIDEVARARAARIDRPLSPPGGMRTLWLLDPDGVSNYFAEFSGNDNRAEARRASRQ